MQKESHSNVSDVFQRILLVLRISLFFLLITVAFTDTRLYKQFNAQGFRNAAINEGIPNKLILETIEKNSFSTKSLNFIKNCSNRRYCN
jgi:hypothetical protein